jgi:hypothetical protein
VGDALEAGAMGQVLDGVAPDRQAAGLAVDVGQHGVGGDDAFQTFGGMDGAAERPLDME